MLNNYLKLKVNNKGFGVYTTVNIPKNTPILEINGDLLHWDDIKDKPDIIDKALQIGQYHHIGPSGGLDDYLNHSCNPNCRIVVSGKRAILYSLYDIKPNTELTFDYSSTDDSTHDEWQMECKCGEANCRKNISGFQHLDKELQKKYNDREISAIYLREPIFNRNI